MINDEINHGNCGKDFEEIKDTRNCGCKDCDSHKENEKTQDEGLKSLMEQELTKSKELEERLIRMAAEYDNFRKRTAKEKDQIYPEAVCYTVYQFLGVIDSIEAAAEIKEMDPEFQKGIDLIREKTKSALSKLGVVEFGKLGDIFDPNKHNAILHVEDSDSKEGEIVEVLQKGYALMDKIIRHAMVKVAN